MPAFSRAARSSSADRPAGARQRPRFRPGEAGPVVGAHAVGCGELGLDQRPLGGVAVAEVVEDDRRTARARAVEVQAVPAHIHELSGRRVAPRILAAPDLLVDGSRSEHRDQQQDKGHGCATQPEHESTPVGFPRGLDRCHAALHASGLPGPKATLDHLLAELDGLRQQVDAEDACLPGDLVAPGAPRRRGCRRGARCGSGRRAAARPPAPPPAPGRPPSGPGRCHPLPAPVR